MQIDPASIVVYVLLLKGFINFDLGIKFAACTAAILPFILNKLYILLMMLIRGHVSLHPFFAPAEIVIMLVQLPIFLYIFARLRTRGDDDVTTYFIYGAVGIFVCCALVPFIVYQFVPQYR